MQEITDSTGMETFATEPQLVKLFQVLSQLLCDAINKSIGFSGMPVTLDLLHFGALLRGEM